MDFNAALDVNTDEIPSPKLAPQGTYTFFVSKAPSVSTSKNGEWTIVEFPIRGLAALDDVDEDALAEYGEPGNIVNRLSFMAPTDPEKENDQLKALDRIRKFLHRTLRIEEVPGKTLRQYFDEAANCQFIAQLIHDPSKDNPEEIYERVQNPVAVD